MIDSHVDEPLQLRWDVLAENDDMNPTRAERYFRPHDTSPTMEWIASSVQEDTTRAEIVVDEVERAFHIEDRPFAVVENLCDADSRRAPTKSSVARLPNDCDSY